MRHLIVDLDEKRDNSCHIDEEELKKDEIILRLALFPEVDDFGSPYQFVIRSKRSFEFRGGVIDRRGLGFEKSLQDIVSGVTTSASLMIDYHKAIKQAFLAYEKARQMRDILGIKHPNQHRKEILFGDYGSRKHDPMAKDIDTHDACYLIREGLRDIAILREAGVYVGSISNDPEEMRGDLEKALGTS